MQTISNFTRFIMEVHQQCAKLGLSPEWDVNNDLRGHLGPCYRAGISPKETAALIKSDLEVPGDCDA